MNKILVGLIFGAVLGARNRASAWFYPEVRSVIASIMVGSTIKGMLVGLLSGWFARKVNSTVWGIVAGSALGLAFAFAVAAMGLIFGAVLGALDGASAWFYPEVRSVIASIMVGSTIKGMLVGLLSGWFARKVNSTVWGIVAGSLLGLAFAFAVAAMPSETGHHYLEIMAPGFVVGAIIGFLTQKMGTPVPAKRTS